MATVFCCGWEEAWECGRDFGNGPCPYGNDSSVAGSECVFGVPEGSLGLDGLRRGCGAMSSLEGMSRLIRRVRWGAAWLFFCGGISAAFGQELGVIWENGPTARRQNILVVSEGYRAEELAQFREDARETVEYLFSEEPFASYRSYFNAYRVEVASAESGADEPEKGIYVDTAFDATFDSSGIARLLTVNTSKVYTTVLPLFTEYDILLVVVNSERYGGSGGAMAVTSVNVDAFDVAAHELGHSFGDLADEYESAGSRAATERPNVTAVTERELIKWNHWIEEETPVPTPEESGYADAIGLFEGAMYESEGWYRPHYNSKMRGLGQPWGAVNAEQLVRKIYEPLALFEGVSPVEADLVVKTRIPLVFEVFDSLPSDAGTLRYEWTLNGEPMAVEGAQATLDVADLENGAYTVAVRYVDETPFVRSDEDGLLEQSREWRLTVELPAVVFPEGSFDEWAYANLPEEEMRLPQLDVDGDGLANLVEFFLGSDPLARANAELGIWFSVEEGRLAVTVNRIPSGSKVRGWVQARWATGEWEDLVEIGPDAVTALGGAELEVSEDLTRIEVKDTKRFREDGEGEARWVRVLVEELK